MVRKRFEGVDLTQSTFTSVELAGQGGDSLDCFAKQKRSFWFIKNASFFPEQMIHMEVIYLVLQGFTCNIELTRKGSKHMKLSTSKMAHPLK